MDSSYALLGSSVAARNAQTMVARAISDDSPLMITGETGTGKTEIGQFIHSQSNRSMHRFIIIKCDPLQEYTFDRDFMQAQNGTLFFQDIDKLSPRLQFVFLKALMGITTPLKTGEAPKIRLMASSSIDLENFSRRGFFREDLYLKFAAISLYLPTLRERCEDIPILINHFIQKFNQTKQGKITAISHDAMKVLLQHTWPNNLQELESFIERVAILKHAGQIEMCDLPPRLRSLMTTNSVASGQHVKDKESLTNIPSNINSNANVSANTNVSTNAHFNSNAQNTHFHANTNEHVSVDDLHMSVSNDVASLASIEENAIDQFVKKEIDLGHGIDFYRIVEAFENRLLQEALKKAGHNKNKAAQLLSMNRTTLVEKLRKRTLFAHLCNDNDLKSKYNSSFTVLDGLGSERKPFEGQSYMTVRNEEL